MTKLSRMRMIIGSFIMIPFLALAAGGKAEAYRYYDENGQIQTKDTYIYDIYGFTYSPRTFKEVPREAYSERIYPGAQYDLIPYNPELGNIFLTTNVTYCYDEVLEGAAAVNKKRAENGLEPLILDENITAFAMKRAAAGTVYGGHLSGALGFPREDGFGYDSRYMENLGMGDAGDYAGFIEGCYEQDAAHRGTIITKDAKYMGIGIVKGPEDSCCILLVDSCLPLDDDKHVEYDENHSNYSADYTAPVDRNWFLGLSYSDELGVRPEDASDPFSITHKMTVKALLKDGISVGSSFTFLPHVKYSDAAFQHYDNHSNYNENGWWCITFGQGCTAVLNADQAVYESSDPSIFTVDDKGNITGVSQGKATLKMYLKDYPEDVREYTITVRKPIFENTSTGGVGPKQLAKIYANPAHYKIEKHSGWVKSGEYTENGKTYYYMYDEWHAVEDPGVQPAYFVELDGKLLEEGTDYVLGGGGMAGIGLYNGCGRFDVDMSEIEAAIKAEEDKEELIARKKAIEKAEKKAAKKASKSSKKTKLKSGVNTELVTAVPKLTKIKAGKKKLTVSWKKLRGIDGYQLQYSTNKKFKTGKTQTIKLSAALKKKTVRKLTRKKRYYVRMRVYKKIDGVMIYGGWSNIKSTRVK